MELFQPQIIPSHSTILVHLVLKPTVLGIPYNLRNPHIYKVIIESALQLLNASPLTRHHVVSLKPQIRGADAGPTSCLLTASLDRTARLWHLDANDGAAAAAAAAAPVMAHPGEVNSAKFDKAPGWDDLNGARSPWSPFMEFGKILFTSFTQISSVYVHKGEYLANC